MTKENTLLDEFVSFFWGKLLENGLPKTTKEDKENHGFGLITINNIISKYNGNIDYSIHDQYLIADITILNVL